MQNGIDAFVPKPIDTRQLNQILNKMIRDAQPPEVVEAARKRRRDINALNLEAAVNMANSPLVQSFIRDAEKTINALESVYANREAINGADMQNHIIHSHAIKSALANMGETALSKRAALLEDWGRTGNTGGMFTEIPEFLRDLKAYMTRICPRVDEPADGDGGLDNEPAGLTDEARVKWEQLREACNDYDKKAARKLAAELKDITREKKYIDALEAISQHLLHSSFPEAGEVANSVLEIWFMGPLPRWSVHRHIRYWKRVICLQRRSITFLGLNVIFLFLFLHNRKTEFPN